MLRELRTLIALAKHGTVTAAANQVGLTQAAASAQIQRLEELLNVQLLDRAGRQVRLNETGADVVSRGEHILELCNELRRLQQGPGARRRLRFGLIQSMQHPYLATLVQSLTHSHPDINVHLELGGSLMLVTMVEQGELDAAVVVKPFFTLPEKLTWIPLLREPFKVVCPARETSKDWRQVLTTLPFIRYDSTSFGGKAVEQFLRQQHLTLECHIESQDVGAILEMVAHGSGAALIPIKHPTRHQKNIRVIDLGQDRFYREIGLVSLTAQQKNELLSEFVQVLQSNFHGHFSKSL